MCASRTKRELRSSAKRGSYAYFRSYVAINTFVVAPTARKNASAKRPRDSFASRMPRAFATPSRARAGIGI